MNIPINRIVGSLLLTAALTGCTRLTKIPPATSIPATTRTPATTTTRASSTIPIPPTSPALDPVSTTVTLNGITGPTQLRVGQVASWTVQRPANANATISYTVCWGDGTCGYGGTEVFQYPDFSRDGTFLHNYDTTGTFTITAHVSDSNGHTAERSGSITVLPSNNSITLSLRDRSATLNGSVGNTLSVTIQAQGGTATYHWQVTGGMLPPGMTIQKLPLPGSTCEPPAVCPPNQKIDYINFVGFPSKAGVYTFELTARDENGNAGKATFTSIINP